METLIQILYFILINLGHQIYQNQQPLSLTALYPSSASSRHGAVGLPLQQQPHQHPHEAALSSASEMPTSGSSNASPTCMTNWAAVSTANNNNHNNSKVTSMLHFVKSTEQLQP